MSSLRQWSNFLSGKKTYIGLLAGAVVYFASGMGWVEESSANNMYILIGTWTGISFRHAISKSGGA